MVWIIYGEELVCRVCAERLVGDTKHFTTEDENDPILNGLAGTNMCERVGPLAFAIGAVLPLRSGSAF